MEFKFRTFKMVEFDSSLKSILHENKIEIPGMIATYNNSGEWTSAIVPDQIIEKLSANQLSDLSQIN